MVAPFKAPRRFCYCGHSQYMHSERRGACLYSRDGSPTGCDCKRFRPIEKKYATSGRAG